MNTNTARNIKSEAVPSKPPVFLRQRFLLDFISQLDNSVTVTDLQKLVFLYLHHLNLKTYEFVPYKFGSYSFQLAEDISTLQTTGHVVDNNGRISAISSSTSQITMSKVEPLRGDKLIKKVYTEYPYFAINSEIIDRILAPSEQQRVLNVKQKLKRNDTTLFTIGYEGKTVECFVNDLIMDDVQLLCDVRRNPLSRKHGFSKNKLKHIVENVGIKYLHISELGIESDKRQSLETQEDYNALFADYRNTMKERKTALEKLYSLLKSESRIALMCFEANVLYCHRGVIKEYFVEQYHVNVQDL